VEPPLVAEDDVGEDADVLLPPLGSTIGFDSVNPSAPFFALATQPLIVIDFGMFWPEAAGAAGVWLAADVCADADAANMSAIPLRTIPFILAPPLRDSSREGLQGDRQARTLPYITQR